jgi:hypothetical protein
VVNSGGKGEGGVRHATPPASCCWKFFPELFTQN